MENQIIGFGEKPKHQTEIVLKTNKEQSPEYSYEKIFHLLWNEINNKISIDLNLKGRNYFLLPLLKKNKLDTWKKIEKEIELIDQKKSTYPYAVRQAIVHFHTLVVNRYINIKYKK